MRLAEQQPVAAGDEHDDRGIGARKMLRPAAGTVHHIAGARGDAGGCADGAEPGLRAPMQHGPRGGEDHRIIGRQQRANEPQIGNGLPRPRVPACPSRITAHCSASRENTHGPSAAGRALNAARGVPVSRTMDQRLAGVQQHEAAVCRRIGRFYPRLVLPQMPGAVERAAGESVGMAGDDANASRKPCIRVRRRQPCGMKPNRG